MASGIEADWLTDGGKVERTSVSNVFCVLEFRDAIPQNYLFIYLKLFIHLFLALVGLWSCLQAFASCSK